MARIRRTLRVLLYGFAAFIVVLIVATAVERIIWRGKVLPGVELIGVSVGGRPADDVTDEVATTGARLEQEPFQVRAGSMPLTFEPGRVGLDVDESQTAGAVQNAGRTGNPVSQLVGTVLRRARTDEIMWDVAYDTSALEAVLEEWTASVSQGATDGTLRFEGTNVIPVEPKRGRTLARPAADRAVIDALHTGRRENIELPVRRLRPEITRDEVTRAAEEARRLLSGPVTVNVDTVSVELAPEQVASMLRPEPHNASLRLNIDHEVLREHLGPDAHALEAEPVDARFSVEGSLVHVIPHSVGRQLDLEQIATGILRGDKVVASRLAERDPEITTKDLEALKVEELVSTFTTYYPAGQERVTNIHRASELTNQTIVRPGQGFSLNDTLGQRTADRGFVTAPVIYAGEFTEDIGGGVSQFATTMFNAAFFGGYPITEYQAHSFYIDRYPKGREATVSWRSPDLRFTNDTDAAILIRTSVSATSVTISFYSTKIREVEAIGPETVEVVPASEQYVADGAVPRGEQQVRESGSDGEVVRVTRLIRNLQGDELDRRVFTTRYKSQSRVIAVHPCDHPDESQRPPPEECVPPEETTTTTAPSDDSPPPSEQPQDQEAAPAG